MYGPFGGTVKVWNSCEHLANIVRRRLRLQLHNVLRSLVTRGTHALSPCKIVYRKKGDTSRPRPAQHELKHTTATPARPLSNYASQLEHSRFSKHAQPVCGMKQEVPKPKPRNDGFSLTRVSCALRGPARACADRTRARARPLTAHAPPPGTGTGTGSKLAQSHR